MSQLCCLSCSVGEDSKPQGRRPQSPPPTQGLCSWPCRCCDLCSLDLEKPGVILGRGRKSGSRDCLSHLLCSQPGTPSGPLSPWELKIVQKVLASNSQQGAALSPSCPELPGILQCNFLSGPPKLHQLSKQAWTLLRDTISASKTQEKRVPRQNNPWEHASRGGRRGRRASKRIPGDHGHPWCEV